MMAAPRAYVTYFDERYLPLAVVMLRSVRRHDRDALVFALCFDELSLSAISSLADSRIVPVSADDLATFEPRLGACRARTRGAFYATHKAVLPLFALARHTEIGAVIHMDADCCLFASPAPLFQEIGEASIALSPHDFSRCSKISSSVGGSTRGSSTGGTTPTGCGVCSSTSKTAYRGASRMSSRMGDS